MPTISKLAVLLTGGIGGFSSAMADGGRELDGFVSHFQSAAGTIAGIGATLGAGAAVAGIISLTKNSFETIAATSRLADTLGVSTESMVGLDHAAKMSGVSTEALHSSLFKMEKVLGGADEEGGKAAEAFAHLGLNAETLAGLPANEALGKIADSLNDVENAADRNAEAVKIFGRGVSEIMPLLSKGSDGLEQFQAEAEKLGLTFNAVDAAKVELANQSVARLGEVITAAAQALAIQLAPFVSAVADKLAGMGAAGGGAGTMIVNGVEAVTRGLAGAADYLELVKSGWYVMKAAGLEAFSLLELGISKLLDALDYLQSKLPGHSKQGWGDGYKAEAEKLESSAVEAFNKAGESFDKFSKGENAAAVGKLFADIRAGAETAARAIVDAKKPLGGLSNGLDDGAKAAEKVKAKLDELQKTVDQFNLTKAEKAGDDVKRMGGSAADQGQAAALQNQLDSLEAAKKAQDELAKSARQMWEENRTPLEKYNEEIAKIGALAEQGYVDEETAARAAAHAKDELDKSAKGKDEKFDPAHLLRAGSQEAASFVAKVQSQARGDDARNKALQLQTTGNSLLTDIRDAVKNFGLAPADLN